MLNAGAATHTASGGLSRSPSTHMLNGNNANHPKQQRKQHPTQTSATIQSTRCDLPTAVHIAQISSSDEDYLDFGEADDFEDDDMGEEPVAAMDVTGPTGAQAIASSVVLRQP